MKKKSRCDRRAKNPPESSDTIAATLIVSFYLTNENLLYINDINHAMKSYHFP